MSETLTTREACKLYGIGRETLETWVKAGCPVVGKRKAGPKGGRPHNLFDPASLAPWAGAHGKNPKGIEGAALKAAAPVAPPTTAREPSPAPRRIVDPPAQLDLVRGQYANLMSRFARLANSNGDNTEIASVSRALTAKGTELRLLEMDVLDWKKQTGALCDYAEMQRLFVDLASGVRERIMALPNELAPVLREYLKDPDDVGKVRDEIDQAIRHALAALPDELPEKSA
jgi:hypothetical protein